MLIFSHGHSFFGISLMKLVPYYFHKNSLPYATEFIRGNMGNLGLFSIIFIFDHKIWFLANISLKNHILSTRSSCPIFFRKTKDIFFSADQPVLFLFIFSNIPLTDICHFTLIKTIKGNRHRCFVINQSVSSLDIFLSRKICYICGSMYRPLQMSAISGLARYHYVALIRGYIAWFFSEIKHKGIIQVKK